jgi:hypothetical protein
VAAILRLSIACLLIGFFQFSDALAQSPDERQVTPRGPVQFVKPSPGITPSAGITPVGINTRMNSIEALRGLSYVRVVLDESFAKRQGLDVSQGV